MRHSGSRSAPTDAAQRCWSGGGGRRGLASEVGGVNYEREYNICCCIKPPVMISGLRGRA